MLLDTESEIRDPGWIPDPRHCLNLYSLSFSCAEVGSMFREICRQAIRGEHLGASRYLDLTAIFYAESRPLFREMVGLAFRGQHLGANGEPGLSRTARRFLQQKAGDKKGRQSCRVSKIRTLLYWIFIYFHFKPENLTRLVHFGCATRSFLLVNAQNRAPSPCPLQFRCTFNLLYVLT